MGNRIAWLCILIVTFACTTVSAQKRDGIRGASGLIGEARGGDLPGVGLLRVSVGPRVSILFADVGTVSFAVPIGPTHARFDGALAHGFAARGLVSTNEASLRMGASAYVARLGDDLRLGLAAEFEAPLISTDAQMEDFSISSPDADHPLPWDRRTLDPELTWYRMTIGIRMAHRVAPRFEFDYGLGYERLAASMQLSPTDAAIDTIYALGYGDGQLKHRYDMSVWMVPLTGGASMYVARDPKDADRIRFSFTAAPGPAGTMLAIGLENVMTF